MSKLSAEAQLNSKVTELLNNLQLEINQGKENYSLDKLKWSISNFDPDYMQNYTRKEFESKYNIKIKNKEYRTEAFNYLYHSEVTKILYNAAKLTLKDITDALDTGNIDKVITITENEILHCHKLKEAEYGNEYYDLSYGNNRFDYRFDVIWFISERNRYKENQLIDPTLPISIDNLKNPIIPFTEYPFWGIDIVQWIDFEKAYRFIPMLKELLQFLRNIKNEFIKFDPNYSLGNVLKKVNRFPNLFKDAVHCELFFHTVQFLPINKIVDWSYLFEILEIDQALKKNIKKNH
ncbi:hypothetical protein [uncultured Maribacter sp.]|uniref:hypothetical protein n=1 Tax=uncultured Maribacter sp. TaxID=431308 RepID=UPI0026124E7D|nr:hypothetical protein [uncultured Maribacter sp.]